MNDQNQISNIIEVLENERNVLLTEFYRPETEGTGHFNTAASVLEMRINEYKTKASFSSQLS
jgi:hypothetical protein